MKKLLLSIFMFAAAGFFAKAQIVFDDAESYKAFSVDTVIAAQSNWTFANEDGKNTVWFGYSTMWPSASHDRSFIVFCPDSIMAGAQGDTNYTIVGTQNTYFDPYSGKKYFASFNAFDYPSSKGSAASDDWMISPAFSGLHPIRISFYAKSFQCAYQTSTGQLKDKFKVWGSKASNAVADFKNASTGVLHPQTTPYKLLDQSSDADWNFFSYTFDAGVKYVAINCVSDAGYAFFVDDITIEEIFPYDITAEALGYPDYSCELTNQETIEMLITNKGDSIIKEFDAVYQIGEGTTPVVEHVSNITILPDSSYIYTFTTPADLTFAMDADSIRGWVELAADDYNANDTTSWYFTGVPASDTVPYFNDFSTEEQFKGYSTLNVNEDDYGWHAYEDEDDNNNMLWFCQTFNDKEAANDWMFTSCFDLKAGSYTLEFLYKGYKSIYNEKLGVYYGDLPDPANMTLIKNYNFSSDVYAKANEAFTIPSDGVYYIGFKAFSDKDNGDIFLDNISLIATPASDIAAISAEVPEISCENTANEAIKITVKNAGQDEITEFKAYYQIATAAVVEETVSETIAAGATYTYTFTTPADLTVEAPASVLVWVALDGDANNANDTANVPAIFSGNAPSVTQFPYKNEFTTEADRLNWKLVNGLNNVCYWDINAEQGYWYHVGLGINSSLDPQYTGGEDWLISSCIDLQAKPYVFEFDYCARDAQYSSSMKIYIGKKVSDNPADYTLIDELNMFTNTTWETYSNIIDIDEAGTYYFAFYGYNDNYAMFIDNFSLRDNVGVDEVNASSSVVLYPNPAQNEISLRASETMSTIAIYDMFGKNVANYQADAAEVQINVSDLASGMYLAKIGTANGTIVKKFTVQK
ncbi:MAG: T9SS type A sorting domain-containing protein [Bacteroidales bacterium]|nr:T9SS type A sorting domain-containing protein [Bacteroidales bacterium]